MGQGAGVLSSQGPLPTMAITVEKVRFPSGGHTLRGRLYKPGGEGPHPGVVVCLGYPGDTKNMDLAEELAFKGIQALLFYYPGAWGSEGEYRLTRLPGSTLDALAWLGGLQEVDGDRLAVAGHSMGALAVVNALALREDLSGGALVSPVADLGPWLSGEALEATHSLLVSMAQGKLELGDPQEFKEDLLRATRRLNPVEAVARAGQPLLFVVGSRDEVTPPDYCRALYEAAPGPKRWEVVEGADHGFSEHRHLLVGLVVDWLAGLLLDG